MKPDALHKVPCPFLRAYLTAAFWTSEYAEGSGDYEENGNGLELFAALSDDSYCRAYRDCVQFQDENAALLSAAYESPNVDYDASRAGGDYWLSRCGHGAGYFDRDLGATGDALQTAARLTGSADLYRGDDGKLYF